MNWLDYLLIFIFILNFYNGCREGFLRQIVGLTSFFITFYLALHWSGAAKGYLQHYLKLEQILAALSRDGVPSVWLIEVLLNIIAFLLVFLVISFLLNLFTRKLKILNKFPVIGPLNIFLGAIIGAIKGLLVVFLIVALLSLIETTFWSNTMEASAVVALSQHYMALIFDFVLLYVVDNLGQLV